MPLDYSAVSVDDIPKTFPPEPSTALPFRSAEDILNVKDDELVPFAIPEWGTQIYFRVMSAAKAVSFTSSLNGPDKRTAIVRMFMECAAKPDGTPLFNKNMLEQLMEKSTRVYMRAQKFLLKLNGFDEPEKNWDTVEKMLTEADVDPKVIAKVKARWAEDDPTKNG